MRRKKDSELSVEMVQLFRRRILCQNPHLCCSPNRFTKHPKQYSCRLNSYQYLLLKSTGYLAPPYPDIHIINRSEEARTPPPPADHTIQTTHAATSDPASRRPGVDPPLLDGQRYGARRGGGLLHLLATPQGGPQRQAVGSAGRVVAGRHGPPHGLGASAGGGFLGGAAFGKLDGDARVLDHRLRVRRRLPLAAVGEAVLALEPLVAPRGVEVVEPAPHEERAGDRRGRPGQRGEVERHPLVVVGGDGEALLLPGHRPFRRGR
uniref:Uncharacterized protein n=1 Tax=Arundo donax TaxID=35708 RepID=A0A0A9D205_ARUDO